MEWMKLVSSIFVNQIIDTVPSIYNTITAHISTITPSSIMKYNQIIVPKPLRLKSNVVTGYYMCFTTRMPFERSGVKPVEFYPGYSSHKTRGQTAVALAKPKAYSPNVEMNPE